MSLRLYLLLTTVLVVIVLAHVMAVEKLNAKHGPVPPAVMIDPLAD